MLDSFYLFGGLGRNSHDVMLAMSEGQMLPNFLGEVPNVRVNLRRLGVAAGLTPEEWREYQQLVETRLRLRL